MPENLALYDLNFTKASIIGIYFSTRNVTELEAYAALAIC